MRAFWLVCLAVISFAAKGRAEEPADELKLVASLLRGPALVVVRLKPAEVTAQQLAQPLVALRSIAADQTQLLEILNAPDRLISAARHVAQAGATEAYLVVQDSADPAPSIAVQGIVTSPNEAAAERIATALRGLPALAAGEKRHVTRSGRFVIMSSEELGPREKAEEQPRAGLTEAFQAAGDASLAIAVLPDADQRRILAELGPLSLPAGKFLQPSFRDLQWCVFASSDQPPRSMKFLARYSSVEAAEQSSQAIGAWKSSMNSLPATESKLSDLKKAIGLLDPQSENHDVRIELAGELLAKYDALLKPATDSVNSNALRAVTTKRFKQIGLAFHNAASANNQFPDTAIRDAQGKPLLSWRVHLLPYLDQEPLYREFRLDEPWDSEHNRKLISRLPDIYRLGSEQNLAAGKTCVLVPVGEATLFPDGKGVALKDVKDGLSNTFLAIEADDSRAVEWTRPEDLNWDPEKPLAGVGNHFGAGFVALVADGSVQYLDLSRGDDVLRPWFTRAALDIHK